MKQINISEISNQAKQYHSSGVYSCAEAVFLTLVEAFEIPLSKEFYGIASGFAGGASCGSLCGASSGGIMAIGLIFGSEQFGKDKTKNKARILAKELNEKFINAQGSLECRTILDDPRMSGEDAKLKCFNITSTTAALAADIIAKELGYEII